eukprot:SRR837773.23889.p2 GENE.SRR837773.23889~~SRR837773.23889.p2  ORF type:complete len:120 (-),score=21.53 SRR837773.23889:33-392(-)
MPGRCAPTKPPQVRFPEPEEVTPIDSDVEASGRERRPLLPKRSKKVQQPPDFALCTIDVILKLIVLFTIVFVVFGFYRVYLTTSRDQHQPLAAAVNGAQDRSIFQQISHMVVRAGWKTP